MFVPPDGSDGNSQSFAAILLSDHKQATESEPNNVPKTASRVNLGEDLNGRLDAPDDVDDFVFHGSANEYVRFTSFSRRLGSPADLALRLLKADGNALASAESQAGQEATLGATLPAAGDYVLEVRDLSHRGGPRFVYHVEAVAEPAKPSKDQKKHGRLVRGFLPVCVGRFGGDSSRRNGCDRCHCGPRGLRRTDCRPRPRASGRGE